MFSYFLSSINTFVKKSKDISNLSKAVEKDQKEKATNDPL